MIKTIRITDEKIHSDLLRIQGDLQAKRGKPITMEEAIAETIRVYKKRHAYLRTNL